MYVSVLLAKYVHACGCLFCACMECLSPTNCFYAVAKFVEVVEDVESVCSVALVPLVVIDKVTASFPENVAPSLVRSAGLQ